MIDLFSKLCKLNHHVRHIIVNPWMPYIDLFEKKFDCESTMACVLPLHMLNASKVQNRLKSGILSLITIDPMKFADAQSTKILKASGINYQTHSHLDNEIIAFFDEYILPEATPSMNNVTVMGKNNGKNTTSIDQHEELMKVLIHKQGNKTLIVLKTPVLNKLVKIYETLIETLINCGHHVTVLYGHTNRNLKMNVKNSTVTNKIGKVNNNIYVATNLNL